METSEDFYRTLCSLETVRSGKKGFFQEFSECVAQVAGEAWISKVFGRLSDDEARMRTVFTDNKIKDTVLGTLRRTKVLYRPKDARASKASRCQGLEAMAAGDLEKALLLLSQAVLRAPMPGKCESVDDGLSLPKALIGRSEVLRQMKEHALALEDVKLAEEVRFPERSRANHTSKEEGQLPPSETCLSLVPSSRCFYPRKQLPRLSGGENPRLPGASSLLDVQETATAGKQAVAIEEIVPGDTLVVEPPLAACLLPEFFGTHCHHCFSRLRVPIGCPDCSSVAFCGQACRDAALASYHKYECKILALLIGSGMSALSMLSLRMVTQSGPAECGNICRALRQRNCEKTEDTTEQPSPPETAPITEPRTKLGKSAKRRMRRKMLRDSRYRKDQPETDAEQDAGLDLRAYQLVAHEKQRSARDFFERSLMAAFLLECLRTVGFFGDSKLDEKEPPTEPEIAVAGLLLRHLQLLQFNAHEVFETRPGKDHRFRGSRPVYIGVAIYPTVARFNHDCYPAVTRYFVGRSIVIRAIRSLRVGDMVAENYEPIFTKRTLEERQRTLAGRYWFRCECTACRENWPRFETMSNDDARLRCPTEGCKKLHRQPKEAGNPVECAGCRRKVDLREPLATLRECEDLYQRGFAAMEEEQPEKALKAFLEAARTFHRIAAPPHRDTHLAEIAASACMADAGNVW
ncbi:protein-lysine N-methyltransferase SMYD4 [Nomia melanderi]|uniref:protein-lysine N-methyltransferase SMYD4 n=1 Tax=Nomia melanderi TaxID=2448451 RepID=UPI003FCDF3CB